MDLNYYFQAPRQKLLSLEERNQNEAAVEKRISFINRTHKPITIRERTNFKFVLPPFPQFQHEQEFIFRIEYFFNSEKVKNNTELLLDRLRSLDKTLEILKASFSANVIKRIHGGIDFIVEYSIPIHVLESLGETVYFSEIDLIVSCDNEIACPNHPFWIHGNVNERRTVDVRSAKSFGVEIFVNDPFQEYGTRFVNILGKVHRITPECNRRTRRGVEVRRYVNGNWGSLFYEFDIADKEVMLFRTEDEALFNGNIDNIVKRELAEYERNNLMLKRELEASKARLSIREMEYSELKQKSDERRLEMDALRAEQEHARALERDRIKDSFESKSYLRKDTSESLKFIPTLVVGLGALFLGIKNLFS